MKRGKLLAKTPCSRGERAALTEKGKLNGWLTHPVPLQSRRGSMEQAMQLARRTRRALQAAACQACGGQVGRAPRSERTNPGTLEAGKSRRSPPAPPAPPPAPAAEACRKAYKLVLLTAGPFPFHTSKKKSAGLMHADYHHVKNQTVQSRRINASEITGD